ncbi:MAG: VWA domain-containing protein, partial [Alphaproteobacteria bacterium]|nr:VWA domain-containing protein [Alphaproteobacteria bacterium]
MKDSKIIISKSKYLYTYSVADFHVCLTPVHYCLIADSSNSISSELWAQLTSVIRSIATGIDIGPGAAESKVALIQYGRKVVRIFNLTDNLDKATVLDAISSAQQLERTRPGGTSTPDAILECLKIFEEQSQTGVPKVIMVFSGGVTRYPRRSDAFEERRLQEAVNMSSAAGTTNYGVIFTGNDPERAQREAVTIAQGAEERAFYATTLAELEMELIRDLACGKNNSY